MEQRRGFFCLQCRCNAFFELQSTAWWSSYWVGNSESLSHVGPLGLGLRRDCVYVTGVTNTSLSGPA